MTNWNPIQLISRIAGSISLWITRRMAISSQLKLSNARDWNNTSYIEQLRKSRGLE